MELRLIMESGRRSRWVAVVVAAAALLSAAGCTSSGRPGSPSGASGPATASAAEVAGDPGDLRAVRLPDVRGPRSPLAGAGSVLAGDDWSLPAWVRPQPNSGFFSELASASDDVHVRAIDLSWRQLQPIDGGPIDRTASGSAQGLSLAPLAEQLAQPGPFWMRLFASGEDWAPAWVAARCGVHGYGPDDDGQKHLPIWDDCVWSALLSSYRALFAESGLRADPRLRFVYVPGAFTWAEFDYETIAAAVTAGDLDRAGYLRWYAHAWSDLAEIFGPYRTKLVFTGEDYPFGPFGADDDLLAVRATAAGIGVRTGITEEFDFHLSQAPAYGSRVLPNGHLAMDETLPIHDGRRVVAVENECYTDCGFATDDPYYPVRQSNLKALQLRANWVYVVPGPSYLDSYRPLWDWVRLSLGATAATSADAWAALRDGEDTYWRPGGDGDASHGTASDVGAWAGRPFVRNLERWLVQVDRPGSVAHRARVDVHTGVLAAENGTAYEGLATDVAQGDTGLAFTLDPAFAAASRGPVLLKVTYRELDPRATGRGRLVVQYPGAGGAALISAELPRAAGSAGAAWRTATVALPGAAFDGRSSAAGTGFRLALTSAGPGGVPSAGTADDVVVRFVRLVRLSAPPLG